MGASIVTRFTAVGGSSVVIYDILHSTALIFLESTEDVGVYQLVLQEGHFRRAGYLSGLEGFDAELAVGVKVCGEVIGALSDHAATGAKCSDSLILRVRVQSSIMPMNSVLRD